jgi:hypothetical protein
MTFEEKKNLFDTALAMYRTRQAAARATMAFYYAADGKAEQPEVITALLRAGFTVSQVENMLGPITMHVQFKSEPPFSSP